MNTKEGRLILDKARILQGITEGYYDQDYCFDNQVIPAVLRILESRGYSEQELEEALGKKVDLVEYKVISERQDVVIRRLGIICEAAKNLPTAFKAENPKGPWKKISGLRDILTHAYFGVTWIVLEPIEIFIG